MIKKTYLQDFVFLAIKDMPKGQTIKLQELYKNVENFMWSGNTPSASAPKHVIDICRALRECSGRGDLPNEPRFKNDIRYAILRARKAGMLKHVGTPKGGEWMRI